MGPKTNLGRGVAAILAFSCGTALAAPGDLDATFGTGGIARLGNAVALGGASGVARRADGKLLVAGNTLAGGIPSFQAARFDANGTPDATFGGGQVTVVVGTGAGMAQAVAAYPGDKVVAVGTTELFGGNGGLAVVRFNDNGTLDTTFAGTGKVLTQVGNGLDSGEAVAIQGDGKIVVAGVSTDAGVQRFLVARYHDNGTLDATFGGTGIVVTPLGTGHGAAYGLAIQPDGKLVVAGFAQSGAFDRFAVARYNADGSPDATFGTLGAVLTPIGTGSSQASGIAIQADGRIVVAGTALDGPVSVFALARYEDDGSPDATFGDAGVVTTPVGSASGAASAVVVQSDGRILAAGAGTNTGDASDFVLVRYMPDGLLDAGFGVGGRRGTPVSTSADGASAIVLQPDDKAVVAGSSASGGPWVLARYDLGSPVLDPALDDDNDGIPNGVEPAEGRDALRKDNDVFGNARLFAMQQYRDFLGREGDAGGIAFYTNLLDTGATGRAQVTEAFFASPEFQDTGAAIVRLYAAFFGRIPDHGGYAFQVNALRTGTPLAAIANNFSLSPEFQATYGALTDAQYVALLYQNVLGRAPSQAEVDFHVARLASGATRGEVMTGFSESPEYRALKANGVFVIMLYEGLLRRAADQAGFDYWVTLLNTGTPGVNLVAGFQNSPEYHDRFLP